MPKAYWISAYRAVTNPAALGEYAKLAGPALSAAGGTFLARGEAAAVMEAGIKQRTVIIEFESVAAAQAAYASAGYKAALDALAGGAERDIRIIEGV